MLNAAPAPHARHMPARNSWILQWLSECEAACYEILNTFPTSGAQTRQRNAAHYQLETGRIGTDNLAPDSDNLQVSPVHALHIGSQRIRFRQEIAGPMKSLARVLRIAQRATCGGGCASKPVRWHIRERECYRLHNASARGRVSRETGRSRQSITQSPAGGSYWLPSALLSECYAQKEYSDVPIVRYGWRVSPVSPPNCLIFSLLAHGGAPDS